MSQHGDFLAEHLHHQLENNGSSHFWHRLRWRWVKSRISTVLDEGKVLDLGAGAGVVGNYFEYLPRLQYHFVEPIASLRKDLCNRYGADRDLTHLTEYRGVKMVLMLDVLEHIEKDLEFLKSLYSKLEVNSNLLILVPARQELWSEWDRKLGHFRRYKREDLVKLGSAAGFSLVDARYLFPEFYLLALIRKYIIRKKEGGADLPVLPKFLNYCVYLVGVIVSAVIPNPPLGSSLSVHLVKSKK